MHTNTRRGEGRGGRGGGSQPINQIEERVAWRSRGDGLKVALKWKVARSHTHTHTHTHTVEEGANHQSKLYYASVSSTEIGNRQRPMPLLGPY